MTLYKPRTPEEIAQLDQRRIPLPESLLLIPEFNGKDTVPIFYFEQMPPWSTSWSANMIYNNGKIEYLYILEGKKGVFLFGYIDLTEIQNFIFKLNQMGLFNVSDESIFKKKYYSFRGCCLEAFFNGEPKTPVRLDASTYKTIDIELSGIKYKIKSYDEWYYVDLYPTLLDTRILAESIDFIHEFLESKRLEINK
jgi:hypothetical protein